ncbi:MCE family protein [Synechococcus sp. RSCCF101]|uniref:MlaD family protein n=1 Tax=Synechococcus sp. RSCCF101 TaxID=2511069 RepID=UPI001243B1E0|nr:MlaD family protein [Synechococcus sp. RSCCF101]QEY32310.1 MCE family protein [Synechococcus sp. RSCCF101]
MRRSVREAIVGFSLVGAVVGAGLFWLWLRGVNLASRTWTLDASFADAGGLAARSPVTFRGVVVGSVRSVSVRPDAVHALLDLHDDTLTLPLPVTATVAAGSLLGGDAQVALVSQGTIPREPVPGPLAEDCPAELILCNGDAVPGVRAPSLETVTETMQRLLSEAERQNLVDELVRSTQQFTETAAEAELFMEQADAVTQDVGRLITDLRATVSRAEPVLANLQTATERAASAAAHVDNITAAFDSPETISDLRRTLVNARELTAKIDAVGGQVEQLTADPQFVSAVRSVTIGLGAFFEELYPARTAPEEPAQTP